MRKEMEYRATRRAGTVAMTVLRMTRDYMRYHLATLGFNGGYLHDPMAAALAVDPGLVKSLYRSRGRRDEGQLHTRNDRIGSSEAAGSEAQNGSGRDLSRSWTLSQTLSRANMEVKGASGHTKHGVRLNHRVLRRIAVSFAAITSIILLALPAHAQEALHPPLLRLQDSLRVSSLDFDRILNTFTWNGDGSFSIETSMASI